MAVDDPLGGAGLPAEFEGRQSSEEVSNSKSLEPKSAANEFSGHASPPPINSILGSNHKFYTYTFFFASLLSLKEFDSN